MKEALDLMDMISPGQIEAYRSKDEEEQNSFIERFKINFVVIFWLICLFLKLKIKVLYKKLKLLKGQFITYFYK